MNKFYEENKKNALNSSGNLDTTLNDNTMIGNEQSFITGKPGKTNIPNVNNNHELFKDTNNEMLKNRLESKKQKV